MVHHHNQQNQIKDILVVQVLQVQSHMPVVVVVELEVLEEMQVELDHQTAPQDMVV